MPVRHLLSACVLVLAAASAARAADDAWPDIKANVFEGRGVAEDGLFALYAPAQAEDAAIVPIAIHLPTQVANVAKSLTLIIDRNPVPVAAVFRFGEGYQGAPEIGERKILTRVRVDNFSKVRAVLETADGKLHMAEKFVMGAGGCSAPASKDADQALANLGKMQVKLVADAAHGERWREAIVMIRHPNFTGMQMDLATRGYTPARYVNALDVMRGGKLLLRMEGGISISEDPNLRFTFDSAGGDALEVRATDTDGAVFLGKSLASGS